jgi:glycosyltransferase involved in cell wall biosynthesis
MLHENGTSFQCDFVGEWHTIDRESFNSMVSDYGLEGRVTAHGGIYSTEKNSFYARADIFVFPSHNEAFPLVLLEAMQHGLPCISTDIGGTSDMITDQVNGYLVPVQRPEMLADRIQNLISDPEKRAAFGARGREIFQDKYTVEKFESQMYKIFTELCE